MNPNLDKIDRGTCFIFDLVDILSSKPVVWFLMGMAAGVFLPVLFR